MPEAGAVVKDAVGATFTGGGCTGGELLPPPPPHPLKSSAMVSHKVRQHGVIISVTELLKTEQILAGNFMRYWVRVESDTSD